MKRSSLLGGLLSAVALLSSIDVAAQQWTRKNQAPDPFVRNIRVFANVPSAGQTTVYVASLANGVSKVVDTGSAQTVTALNNGLPVLRIRSVQANDSVNLYVATDGHGVYKSVDSGASWAAANGSGITALKCREVRNITVRSNSEIWAVTGCRHDSGVYRTLDGGATWSRLGAATIPDDSAVGSITFSGTGGTTIAVIATARDGMFRSGDNGATWAQINNGLPAPNGPNRISVFNAVFLAVSTDMLAYVEGHGVYRTTDSGANWAAFGTGFPATAHSLGGIQRQSATTHYLGTDKGPVYRTTDGGANWSPFGNTGNADEWRFIRSVATDGLGRTYLSGHNGLVRTTDVLTFQFIYLGEGFASDMILDPDGRTFYVTAQSLYRVADAYKPFGPGNDGVDIGVGIPGSMVSGHIAQDKHQPATMYAGVANFGLYKTANGGGGWSKLDLPNVQPGSAPFVAISPSDGQVLYGVPGNKYGTATGGGIYKSTNGGSTWADSSTGLLTPEARDVNSVALHQDAPLAVVIATDDGLYRSTDGGATWTNTLQIFDDQATALPMSSVRYHPFDPTIVYAAANHVNADSSVRASSGVWKSTNGGSTWSQVLSGKRAGSIRVEGSGRVIVMLNRDLSQPALLASSDGGVTWPPFNNGIADNDGVTLASSVREQGSKVVFTSMTTGMYTLDQRPPRLANISTRGQVQTGFDVMIGGFVVSGSSPKTVIIRAIGPSLTNYGVPGALPNPTLELVRMSDNTVLATNDDWGTSPYVAQIQDAGLAPVNPLESVIYATLPPGLYTAVVSGVNNSTGVGLVEVYEIDHPEVALINISTRGKVQTGFDVMIGGFVVLGDGPQTVVIRAIGPSLTQYGVAGALANPTMQLVRISDNAVLANNDDWQSGPNVPQIQASGHAPSNPLESAIYITLQPGAYTAVVSGVNGATGVGLVEVYTVP